MDSLLLLLFAAPHNGATMGVKGSPEMGKNKNWQSTFLDTLVARKHRNISNIGKVKGSRKSTKFSTPFLCTQKSLNFTMIKRPWQRLKTENYNTKKYITMNRFASIMTTLVVAAITVGCGCNDATERRIDSLISQMTLEEKIGQLNQISHYNTDAMCREVAAGNIGSILNLVDPVEINKIQKAAVEESRLGIPLVFARDVIHGFRTIFPIPLGQAASFDPEIVEKGARIAAQEAVASGVRWTFSPMVDISRDNRWGRIAESFGEDPYLTSELALAMLRGYEQNDKPLAACAKHFVGYGASEGG